MDTTLMKDPPLVCVWDMEEEQRKQFSDWLHDAGFRLIANPVPENEVDFQDMVDRWLCKPDSDEVPDLIITGAILPRHRDWSSRGWDSIMIAEMRSRRMKAPVKPKTKMILCTRWAAGGSEVKFAGPLFDGVLHQPVTREEYVGKVREVLGLSADR